MDAKTLSEFEKWFCQQKCATNPMLSLESAARWGIEHERNRLAPALFAGRKGGGQVHTRAQLIVQIKDLEEKLFDERARAIPLIDKLKEVSKFGAIKDSVYYEEIVDVLEAYESEGT